LEPDGVYVLALMHSDPEFSIREPSVCYHTDIRISESRSYSLRYEIAAFDKTKRQLSMRRIVECNDDLQIEDEYLLQVYTTSDLLGVAMQASAQLVTIVSLVSTRSGITAPEAVAVLRQR
jgi:hypothetical protein